VVAGSKAAITVSLGEELEEEDGITHVGKGGVGTQGVAEVRPDGPRATLCAGA